MNTNCVWNLISRELEVEYKQTANDIVEFMTKANPTQIREQMCIAQAKSDWKIKIQFHYE